MRIAVLHNYLDNIGGAEMVGLTLAKELKADVYTTNIDHDKIRSMGFSGIKIKSIGKVPINAPLRQQMALRLFRKLDLRGKYDLFIIDGDWAVSAAVNNRPNIWYCHSPIREIWDLYEYTRNNVVGSRNRLLFDIWVRYNRFLSRRYVKSVDKIIVNSRNVQGRVKTYLRKDSTIINPPINTGELYYRKSRGYWLSVNRLINHKRVELQMKAFERLPNERLVVVGCYEKSKHFSKYTRYIDSIKPDNVTLVADVSRKELVKYYAECKAFITTSLHEDFGMTPVEAMAAGKPVVAVDEGGYKETVLDGKTGFLVEPRVYEIVKAMKIIGKNPAAYRKACQERAKEFDTKEFVAKIKKQIAGLNP
jgi:glycosyltransferase involved in cell wall biosynthesis